LETSFLITASISCHAAQPFGVIFQVTRNTKNDNKSWNMSEIVVLVQILCPKHPMKFLIFHGSFIEEPMVLTSGVN
jgi:hypothetical protein